MVVVRSKQYLNEGGGEREVGEMRKINFTKMQAHYLFPISDL